MEHQWIIANLNDNGSFERFLSKSRESIPILFEDNHLLIVIKPEGILSQSDGSSSPDMLTLLKEYIKVKSNKPGDVFLGLVHRLDRPVSGVMVFAKTSKSASRLSAQIREKTVEKRYFAIVHGIPSRSEDTLRSKLQKSAGNIVNEDEEGKEAVLFYKTIGVDSNKNTALLEVVLETGRSHQIRVQLSCMGHPILGDRKYGDPDDTSKNGIMLFSYSFQFKHPTRDSIVKAMAIPQYIKDWRAFQTSFDCFFDEKRSEVVL